MARRITHPEFKTLSFSVSGVTKELDEELFKKLVEAAVKEASASAAVKKPAILPKIAAIKTPKLRNRNLRKAAAFVCTYTEDIGGKKIVGCGRSFTKAKTLTAHMDHVAGIWADTVRFPHYCLDAIVTPDLRDDR